MCVCVCMCVSRSLLQALPLSGHLINVNIHCFPFTKDHFLDLPALLGWELPDGKSHALFVFDPAKFLGWYFSGKAALKKKINLKLNFENIFNEF